MSTEMATGINHGQCRLVFVSRPGQTKTSVPWHLSQCHVQETDLSFAGHHVARDSVATVRPFSISSRHCTVVPSSSRSLAQDVGPRERLARRTGKGRVVDQVSNGIVTFFRAGH